MLRKYKFRTPKVGIALGSGAAKGWAHIGVLQALQEYHIDIHVITGTSAGAVIGAFYAADALTGILDYAKNHKTLLQTFSMMDFSLKNGGLVAGKKFLQFLSDYLPVKRFKDLKIPLGIVATDLVTMEEVIIEEGSLINALRASVSVPGFLAPLEIQGMQLVDGALCNPVPVDIARILGADIVIGVDLNFNPAEVKANSLIQVMDRSIETMMKQIQKAKYEKVRPDVIITPHLKSYKFIDYHRTNEAILAGYNSTIDKISEIKKIINKPIVKHQDTILNAKYLKDMLKTIKRKSVLME